MRLSRIVCLVALGLGLGACANRAGVEEFRLYAASVDDLVAASEPMLARLGAAERRYHLDRVARGQPVFGVAAPGVVENGYVDGFIPAHAVLYSELGDPPYTAGLRHSLATVAQFNATLLAFADGRALDSLAAEAAQVRGDADRALAALDLAQTADLATAIPGAGAALAVIRQGAGLALAAGSTQAFRDALLARQDAVRTVIDTLIASSAATFDLQTWTLRAELPRATGTARDQGIARLEDQRRAMAEWVGTLTRVRAGFDRAVAAIDPGAAGAARLDDAVEIAAGVRAGTQRLREVNLRLGE